jgi:hypothetical protein
LPDISYTPAPEEISIHDESPKKGRLKTIGISVLLATEAIEAQSRSVLTQPEIIAQSAVTPIAQPVESAIVEQPITATPVPESPDNLDQIRVLVDQSYEDLDGKAA